MKVKKSPHQLKLLPYICRVKEFNKASFWTILLTVFIDMLGVGIIIPVIPSLFFGVDSGFFGPEVTETSKSIWYGFLLACFPAMQFIGAPLLGALSDRTWQKANIVYFLSWCLCRLFVIWSSNRMAKSRAFIFQSFIAWIGLWKYSNYVFGDFRYQ